MMEQFIARATEAGAQPHGPMRHRDAGRTVVELFKTAGAEVVLLSPDLGGLRAPIAEALAEAGAKFVEDPAPQVAARAGLGVSRAALAVAETGSVAIAGNELFPRLASMLPLVHLVVVEKSTLVPSLEEAAEYLRRASLGEGGEAIRYLSLVTGPSRTADIEKTLSTGVHGPRELHLLLVE